MGWFARLFGDGHPTQPVAAPQPAPPSIDKAFLEREMAEARRRDAAMKILWEYAGVLASLTERRERTGMWLFPESLLPYPKAVIQDAFALIQAYLQEHQLQHWYNVPKDAYTIMAVALEADFAPDAEVPEDPNQNMLVWSRWLRDQAELDAEIKADPEKEDHILASSGFPPEVRERRIQAAIARAVARERRGP